MPDCPQCGKPFEPNSYSGDFCPACADSIRAELGPRASLDRLRSATRTGAQFLATKDAPFVMFALVAINVGFFVALNSFDRPWARPEVNWLFSRLAMEGQAVFEGEIWRLLTGTFLHSSWLHLASSVSLLFLLGWPLERRLGHSSFFVLWLSSGLFGSLAGLIFERVKTFSAGSSGVVFGFLGAWLALYSFGRLPLPPARRIWRPILLAALVSLWIVGEWLLLRRINIGHLGGAVAGILLGASLPLASAFSWKRLVLVCAISMLAVPAGFALAWQVHGVDLELDQLFGRFYPRIPVEVPAALVPDLERIVARHPDHVRAQFYLAEAYFDARRYDAAIASYRKLLALEPAFDRSLLRMGWAFLELRRPSDAEDAFSRFLRLQPGDESGQLGLAQTYECAGRLDDAIALHKRILSANPKALGSSLELERLESRRSGRRPPLGIETDPCTGNPIVSREK